ncbi:hypothetical protein [Sphingomonas sp. R1]|uniref:hypothetical protein n=1 Tax=Sphingomonas sp. R1 TaxID=399176 RepID=UPI00222503FC|nr:hypothetical protein [Sphingomonas sp. R1]UYY77798.1 hypothetical protein OIM94_01970 [Sphingomonas sp. R1]
MAVIDLTPLPIAKAVPVPLTFGGVITSTTGGASQRVDRMGSRWQFQFATKPMFVSSGEYRQWAALLGAATRLGGLCAVKVPGRTGIITGPTVVGSLVTGGRLLQIAGIGGGYTPSAGDWISIIVGGQRYLDRITTSSGVSGGNCTVQLENLIRVPIPANAVAELAAPRIEGDLVLSATPEWDVASGMKGAFEFTITEAR